jgi:hypothetical protein
LSRFSFFPSPGHKSILFKWAECNRCHFPSVQSFIWISVSLISLSIEEIESIIDQVSDSQRTGLAKVYCLKHVAIMTH